MSDDKPKPGTQTPANNALDKLADADLTGGSKALKREGVIAAMSHFDDVDAAAARKSSKAKPGEMTMPETVKGTPAAEQLAKYQKLAAEIQQMRETLDNKRSWTEKGTDKAARVEKLKADIAQRNAEMRQVRQEFTTQNKANVDYVNGLRANRRLDGLSILQGSLILTDNLMNGNPNTPGRTTQITLATAQLAHSTVGAGINTAALWKPESEALKRVANGFGATGNGFGVGLNTYSLVEQWNSGGIKNAFDGDNAKMKTWRDRTSLGSNTSFLVGDLASLGSRGAAWYAGTTTSVGTASRVAGFAKGANVVGLILMDAQLIMDDVRKWNEFQDVTRDLAAGWEAEAVSLAGSAGVSQNYVDIPGTPPGVNDYKKLYLAIRGVQGARVYDPNGLDREIKNAKDIRKLMRGYEGIMKHSVASTPTPQEMQKYAKGVSVVNDSLGGAIASIFTSEEDMQIPMKLLQAATERLNEGKSAAIALEEFNGSMPNGTRNYVARMEDYLTIVRPLEEKYPYESKHFLRLPGMMRAMKSSTRNLGLKQIGIDPESADGKAFAAAVARGEALDQARLSGPIRIAIESKNAENIRKALEIDEETWNYRYGTNKSMKEETEELLRTNNVNGLQVMAWQFVQNNGEAKAAATGWLARYNFKEEMTYVDKFIAADVKSNAEVGKGEVDGFFQRNAAFRKAGGDKWKTINFSLVGLSKDYKEHIAKKMEFAPLTMVDEVRKQTQALSADLVAALKDNEELSKRIQDFAAFSKELGSELEDMEIRDAGGELIMKSDGKGGEIPMTVADRVNIYNDSIRREEEVIKLMEKRITDNLLTYETKEEVEAKIQFHKMGILKSQMEREQFISVAGLQKLKQADQIEKEYVADIKKTLDEIKKIDGDFRDVIAKALDSPDIDKTEKEKLQAAIKELEEKQSSFEALKKEGDEKKKDISTAEALKSKAALLKARKNLVMAVKEIAPKTKNLPLPKDKKMGMAAPMPQQSDALASSDLPSLDVALASLTQMPESFAPDLPMFIQKKAEKTQLS